MTEKQVEWFISGLRSEFKRAMEKIYLTYIDALQAAVEIESQPWRVNIVNNDLSSQLMKLMEQIDKLSA